MALQAFASTSGSGCGTLCTSWTSGWDPGRGALWSISRSPTQMHMPCRSTGGRTSRSRAPLAFGSWCPAGPRSSSPMRNGSIAFPCRGPERPTSPIRMRRGGPPTISSSWIPGDSLGSRPSTRQASGCCRCRPDGFVDGSCSPGEPVPADVVGRSSLPARPSPTSRSRPA